MKKVENVYLNGQRLKTLMDFMPDFICFKDEKGRWINANDFALKLFQLENVDYYGKKDSELGVYTPFFRESLLACAKSDEETWEKGIQQRVEEIIILPNGDKTTFDVIKVPAFNSDGSRKGLVVIGRNITEQKKSEKKLKESEQRYKSLFENNCDGIISFDLDGIIQSINPSIKNIIGYGPEDLLNRHYSNFISEHDQAKISKHFQTLLDGGTIASYELTIVHKNGHDINLKVSNMPIILDEKVVGIYAIIKDITEIKKQEEIIRKSEKLSVVGQLAAGIAHEIRNPLTSLKGFMQLLKPDIKENHHYEIMYSELNRIENIVSEFLLIAKPQTIQFRENTINHILNYVIELFKGEVVLNNIVFEKSIEENLPSVKRTCPLFFVMKIK